MILVVFGGVNHRAGLHTNLLEQVPNFLINVLLWETNRQKILAPAGDQRWKKMEVLAYVSCDDHTAQLIYDEDVELGRRLAELLLQDL